MGLLDTSIMFYKVFYTDKFIPKRFDGYTVGPIIFIRPKDKDDRGLLEHEKTHVKQFYRDPRYAFRMWFSKKWQLRYEVEAYKKQLEYSEPRYIYIYANFLRDKYGFDITQEEALELLRS